jgi:hypothetical protein
MSDVEQAIVNVQKAGYGQVLVKIHEGHVVRIAQTIETEVKRTK